MLIIVFREGQTLEIHSRSRQLIIDINDLSLKKQALTLEEL